MGPSNMPYVKFRHSVPDCQPLQVLPGPSGQVAVAFVAVCICLGSEIAVCIFSMTVAEGQLASLLATWSAKGSIPKNAVSKQ